jgi:hypothetical protein
LNLEQPSLQLGLIFVVGCGENPLAILAILQVAGGFLGTIVHRVPFPFYQVL